MTGAVFVFLARCMVPGCEWNVRTGIKSDLDAEVKAHRDAHK